MSAEPSLRVVTGADERTNLADLPRPRTLNMLESEDVNRLARRSRAALNRGMDYDAVR